MRVKTIKTIPLSLGLTLIGLVLMQSCIKEPIHAIPMVDLNVLFQEGSQAPASSVATKADADVVNIYFYPNFDYSADPILVRSSTTQLKVALLPGDYGVLMHSAPIEPLFVSGAEDFASLALNLPPAENGILVPCPTVYAMNAKDEMRRVTIDRHQSNSLVFKPVVISKKIRFVINTEKFGNMISARATLDGVATSVNLSSLVIGGAMTLPIDKLELDGVKLTTQNIDLLGFTTNDDQKVTLNLFIKNQEVDYELEQPIDLNNYLEDMVGDEIEISISVSFNPDIRIHPVTIKQWQDGNELEVGIK